MSHKKDYRNMKQTQFDGFQVLKGSFSELASALRVIDNNAILRDSYTHFVQTLDGNDRPLEVTYYQAVSPTRDQLNFIGDTSQSLAGEYIIFQEPVTKKTQALYYVVDGNGTAPGVADIEIPINISENDNAATVCFATKDAIDNIEDFIVIKKEILANNITIEYQQFGEADSINLGTTGFFVTRIQEGDSIEVGHVELSYDNGGTPIYNGNLLKGLVYNPYTASFDAERVDVEVNVERLTGNAPTVYNISMPVAGTEYSQVLPVDANRFQMNIRDHKSKYRFSWVSGGPVVTKSPGTVYKEEMLELVSGDNIIYFSGDKNNLIMEIIVWK